MTANTVEEFEAEVGAQLKSLRLTQNIDRTTLALRAGCSLSALKNLESGNGSTLRTLIVVVRALGKEDWLRHVAPMATISPLNMPRTGYVRKRARQRALPSTK
jgi:transcriptional regulator with XRE-family HTH domain